MSFVGWRLIPQKPRARVSAAELFKIEGYVTEAVVSETSPLIDRRLGDIEREAHEKDAELLGLVRNKKQEQQQIDPARLLQAVRDRERQRQKDKARRAQAAVPGLKDW